MKETTVCITVLISTQRQSYLFLFQGIDGEDDGSCTKREQIALPSGPLDEMRLFRSDARGAGYVLVFVWKNWGQWRIDEE